MKEFSIHEVIEQAIRTEQLGYEFYTQTAKKFEDDNSLNTLFLNLAEKERHHEEVFTRLKDKVDDQDFNEWEEVSNYFRAVVESEFFLGKNKSLPSLDHITSVKEAVRFAISFEKETLLYFVGIKSEVHESDSQIVEEIIEEEKSHIIWLTKFRDSLPVS